MFRSLLSFLLCLTQAGALPLTPEQSEALAEARQRYKVSVLEHPDGDVVVLLGESHIKMRKSHDLGQSLLELFGVRGLEREDGAETSHRLRRQRKVTDQIFDRTNRITRGHGPYGSTLTDALSVEPLSNFGEKQIVQLERRSPGEAAHPMTRLYDLEFTITQYAIPLSLVSVLGINRYTIKFLTHVAPSLLASLLLGYAFARPWNEATLAEKVAFHVYYGAVERRDNLMALNIVRSRDQRQDQPLLVIVGTTHVRGLAGILKSRYGYVEAEPSEPAAEAGALKESAAGS